MKLREIMSNTVVRIHPEETVAVAARMLEHNNIGALPVCGGDGRLCGMVTDRDLKYHGGGKRGKLWFERMKGDHRQDIINEARGAMRK